MNYPEGAASIQAVLSNPVLSELRALGVDWNAPRGGHLGLAVYVPTESYELSLRVASRYARSAGQASRIKFTHIDEESEQSDTDPLRGAGFVYVGYIDRFSGEIESLFEHPALIEMSRREIEWTVPQGRFGRHLIYVSREHAEGALGVLRLYAEIEGEHGRVRVYGEMLTLMEIHHRLSS